MWVARAFSKTDDSLVREVPLSRFSGHEVRPFLKLAPDDPMYDAYPITPAIAEVLMNYLSEPLDLEGFDWFLEFDKDDPPCGTPSRRSGP